MVFERRPKFVPRDHMSVVAVKFVDRKVEASKSESGPHSRLVTFIFVFVSRARQSLSTHNGRVDGDDAQSIYF